MEVFWWEFAYFFVHAMAMTASFIFAVVFLRLAYEKRENICSRGFGISALFLSLTFFLYIAERRFPEVLPIAAAFGALTFFTLLLTFLNIRDITPILPDFFLYKKSKIKKQTKRKRPIVLFTSRTLFLSFCIGAILVLGFWYGIPYQFLFLGISVLLTFFTVIIGMARWLASPNKSKVRYVWLGISVMFFFLFLRACAHFFYRFPLSDIPAVAALQSEFGMIWIIILYATLIPASFFGLAGWYFIKKRKGMRDYVTLLVISVLVATTIALLFTYYSFTTIQNEQQRILEVGVQTQRLLMEEDLSHAFFTASLIAGSNGVLTAVQKGDYVEIKGKLLPYFDTSRVDTLRVFNRFGEVIISITDPREVGELHTDDTLLANVISKKTPLKTFALRDAVPFQEIIGRSIYPMVYEGKLLGAVETTRIFDTAYLDAIKEQLNLEVSIYSDGLCSATTVEELKSGARFIGYELDDPIIKKQLSLGATCSALEVQFGGTYFAAFDPIRDINDKTIGIISISESAERIIEEERLRLVSLFIIIIFVSFIFAAIGYGALRGFTEEWPLP